MKANEFEDLRCWQMARQLCKMIHSLTLKQDFSRDFELVNQIRASCGSAMDNIAEGFERGGNKEFVNFLYISKSSLAETRSQLYRALDSDYITQGEFQESYDTNLSTKRMIISLIKSLRNNRKKVNAI